MYANFTLSPSPMSLPNYVIQIIGLVGAATYLVSFQFKKNRHLFMMQAAAYVFYFTHFYLLGALTGGFIYLTNLLRSLFLASKWKWAHSQWACVGLCTLQIIIVYFTWDGWISILPCIANIASTVGGYTYNPKKIRAANMFINSPVCIIYAVLVGSWAGVIDELTSEASIIISIIRYGWHNLDEVQSTE